MKNYRSLEPGNWESVLGLQGKLTTGTLLTHPKSDEPLAIVTDVSDSSIGAVLQQRVEDDWEPLAPFSRKLSPAESKYRELLPVYSIIKVLRAHDKDRTCTVFVYRKRLTFAFRLKADKCLPRQVRHMGYIAQFTTDIRNNTWKDNIVFSYILWTVTSAQTRKGFSVESHTHIHPSGI